MRQMFLYLKNLFFFDSFDLTISTKLIWNPINESLQNLHFFGANRLHKNNAFWDESSDQHQHEKEHALFNAQFALFWCKLVVYLMHILVGLRCRGSEYMARR